MSWEDILKYEPVTSGTIQDDLTTIIDNIGYILEYGCEPNAKPALSIQKVTRGLMKDLELIMRGN